MNVYVTSELYNAGTTEDGQVFSAERYLVVAEAANGARHSHITYFNGCEVRCDDQHGYTAFVDIRTEAMARAELLAYRVRAAGTIDLTFWDEMQPAYGSAAYEGGGYELQRKYEELQAG